MSVIGFDGCGAPFTESMAKDWPAAFVVRGEGRLNRYPQEEFGRYLELARNHDVVAGYSAGCQMALQVGMTLGKSIVIMSCGPLRYLKPADLEPSGIPCLVCYNPKEKKAIIDATFEAYGWLATNYSTQVGLAFAEPKPTGLRTWLFPHLHGPRAYKTHVESCFDLCLS